LVRVGAVARDAFGSPAAPLRLEGCSGARQNGGGGERRGGERGPRARGAVSAAAHPSGAPPMLRWIAPMSVR
jgi:hypothetical protein